MLATSNPSCSSPLSSFIPFCSCLSNFVVIEFEGFHLNSPGLVVKELSICSENSLDTIFFKPPCKQDNLSSADQNTIVWLSKSLHGLSWEEGYYDYNDRFSIYKSISLRYPRAQFYAKGADKCKRLGDLLEINVTNLEDVGCPKATSITLPKNTPIKPCTNHSVLEVENLPNGNCAQKKSLLFYHWLKERNAAKLEGHTQATKLLIGKLANLRFREQSLSTSSSDSD